jgi:hypothetical protein
MSIVHLVDSDLSFAHTGILQSFVEVMLSCETLRDEVIVA